MGSCLASSPARQEVLLLTCSRLCAALCALALWTSSTPASVVAAAPLTVRSRTVEGPDPRVLDLALAAASCATQSLDVKRPSLLTIIDYSRPSTQTRLWVIDLAKRRPLFKELVAHGRGSGDDRATRFSNDLGSHQSSLGLFLTGETYVGSNGYSLRLDGLEPGINDRARERAIVMHGASYVSRAAITALGRLGRSWGCPAVSNKVAKKIINTVRGGSAVFAYYPEKSWLANSQFFRRKPNTQVAAKDRETGS